MCLGEQCAMWRRFHVEGSACGSHSLISPTPQGGLHTSHTHTQLYQVQYQRSGEEDGMHALSSCVYSKEQKHSGCKPLFPEDRSGTIRRVYGWKSHGVNFGILLFWGQRKLATKQLEWWERRSFLTRHMTLTAFLPFQTQLSHFSVPAHFTELWMWSLIFVGFGKNCQETPKWIFKRLSDKRLKRSVPLGSWVMKYAFEFTKFLWPCNLLKYMFAYLNICFYFTPQHRKNKSSITENVLTV